MLNILSIILFLELSYGMGANQLYEIPDGVNVKEFMDGQYYLMFGTELTIYEYFYLRGSAKIKVFMSKEELSAFPTAMSSYFEAGVLFNGFKAGWKHFCTHPITPYFEDNTFFRFYDESGDEFFIQYKTNKIKVF